jgi:hypothetical protein
VKPAHVPTHPRHAARTHLAAALIAGILAALASTSPAAHAQPSDQDEAAPDAPAPAPAPRPRPTLIVTVLDSTLTPFTGELLAINAAESIVTLRINAEQRQVTAALALLVRSPQETPPRLPGSTPADPTTTIELDLTDGQRWIFPLAEVRFDGERILTPRSPAATPLPLERVRRIVTALGRFPSTVTAVPASDTLRLRSGDQLSGFVAGLTTVGDTGDFTVRIEPDTKGEPRTIPSSAISLIELTNPPTATSAVRLWLRDGQRLAVEPSLTPGREWTIPAPATSQPHTLDLTAIGAMTLTRAGAPSPLVPLAAIALTSDAPPEADRPTLGPDAPLGLSEITIPEPQTVRWTLPPNATRLAMTLVLREDCRQWGECDLRLTLGTDAAPGATLLHEGRLTPTTPSIPLNIELPLAGNAPRILTLTITPGQYGPIQDRVVIREAMLLRTP